MKDFNVFTVTLPSEKDWSPWEENLTMYITKNGVTIELKEEEIKELVQTLPRTFGGKY